MTRRIWCRHDDCDHSDLEEAGKRPSTCPSCRRVAAWTLEPKTEATIIRAAPRGPDRPDELTLNDKRLLRSLRIAWPDASDEDDQC